MQGNAARRNTRVHWISLCALLFGISLPVQAEPEKPPGPDSPPSEESADPETRPSGVEEIERPQNTKSGKKVEEIVVTGSRVKDNYNGLGPVTTIGEDDLALAGVFTVSDLLRERPALDFDGSNQFTTNGGRGRNTIGLRGLGPGRVLILLNGRRFVQSSNGASDAVDLGNFAPQLIEGVDILRDGVSTIYGADAVAGVINIRTRTDFEGFRVGVAGGSSDTGDGDNGQALMLWGKNFSRGNLTIGATLAGNDSINLTDRSFTRRPIQQATRNPDGTIDFRRDIFSFPQGVALLPSGDIQDFNPGENGASFSPFDDAQTDQRNINETFDTTFKGYRSSVTGLFTYELSNSVELFSEWSYSMLNAQARFSPTFVGTGATAKNPLGFTFPIFRSDGGKARSNNPFLGSDLIDLAFDQVGVGPSSGIPAGAIDQAMLVDGLPAGAIPLTLVRGLDEFGPRQFKSDVRTLRTVVGVRGSTPGPIDDVSWEAYINYGRSKNREITKNEVNLTRALASAQPDVCAQTPGCAVGDFFGVDSLLGTPEALSFIQYDAEDDLTFHLREIAFEAATTVAKLPAGNMRMSIGAQFRDEDGDVDPDAVALSGDTGGLSRQGTRGRQLVREYFVEAEIPLVEGITGIRDLSVNLSSRLTDYSTFGARLLTRYAASWAPIDSVRLRGVYATAFRSPSISDLFLGPADSFVGVSDRCNGFPNIANPTLRANCARELERAGAGPFTPEEPFDGDLGVASRQVRANVGGNRELKEETADIFNLGVVFTPSWLPGASLAVDYYNIEVDDPVVGQSPQFRVDNCLVRSIDSECGATQRDSDGLLTFIDIPRTNFGSFETNGIDFGAEYTTRWPIVGNVRFSFEGVYTMDFEINTAAGKGNVNGIIGGAGGGLPNLKAFFRTAFQPTEELTIGTSVQYIGGSKIVDRRDLGLPFDHTSDVMYVDAGITYELTDRIRLDFSCQNLTDKEPELVIGDNVTNTNTDQYDLIGRSFFAQVRVDF
jgi:iron complex outermembrane recepter protein